MDRRPRLGQEAVARAVEGDLRTGRMQRGDARDPGLQRSRIMGVVVADVQLRLRLGGDEVGGWIANIDARHLQAGGFEPTRPCIQAVRREVVEQGQQPMHRIIRQMRIGDMALNAGHGDGRAEAAATPDLDDLAEAVRIGRLPHHTEIRHLAMLAHPLHDAHGAVPRRPLLVARDEQRDRSRQGFGRLGLSHARNEGCNRRLHIAGAAPMQHAILDHAAEGVVLPSLAGGHHVGMTRKAEMRRPGAEPRV